MKSVQEKKKKHEYLDTCHYMPSEAVQKLLQIHFLDAKIEKTCS